MNNFGFPKQNKSQEIGRKGEVYFSHYITTVLGWIYRTVPQESDFGIDGFVDIVINGSVTGKSLAVQIKCGDSYISKLTTGGLRYDGENRHLNYYMNQTNPIILIVCNNDFSQAYWVMFDIEKTSSSKNGWWQEIPKSNTLDQKIIVKWLEIVGLVEDYSDRIRHNWVVDEAISEADITYFTIPKEDVLTSRTEHIERMIKKLTKNYELMLNKRNSIEIYFPEFNLNYPEVYEISEIRNWFKKSVIKGIPWFYFLNVEEPSISLNLLLYCTCDVKVLNIKDQNHILEIIYKEQILHWIETNFHNLNLFIDSNNIPEEINQEISESIGDWISKNLIGF